MKAQLSFWLLVSFVVFCIVGVYGGGELSKNFYKKRCPRAEVIVRDIIRSKVQNDSTLGAKLLRLHYHDCFVKGCDASILLDTVGGTPSEKEARPNLSLSGFGVIDEIKSAVNDACPGVVSCADILALAARDAVSFPFNKPMWDVLTGRKDGKTSLASDVTNNLPSPFSNFTTLQKMFEAKRLDIIDLVALSGAHTLGVSHCGAFSRRIFNFSAKSDIDPLLDPTYAAKLKGMCPLPTNANTTVEMDPQSSLSFDSHYFNILTTMQGLFQSDAALLDDKRSRNFVEKFKVQKSFFSQFGKSMMKMGAINEFLPGDAGEIRENCHRING